MSGVHRVLKKKNNRNRSITYCAYFAIRNATKMQFHTYPLAKNVETMRPNARTVKSDGILKLYEYSDRTLYIILWNVRGTRSNNSNMLDILINYNYRTSLTSISLFANPCKDKNIFSFERVDILTCLLLNLINGN